MRPAVGLRPPGAWRVAYSGLAAVAVGYGFARYAFGLYLPALRADFGLSVADAGLLGSASYAGYLLTAALAGRLTTRFGPRLTVTLSATAAAGGLSCAALSESLAGLAVGLAVAGASAGLAWTLFADAVERAVPAERRATTFALIASGTAFGLLVAAPTALIAAGSAWRSAWLVMAVAAVVVAVGTALSLPGPSADRPAAGRDRRLRRPGVLPLCVVAFGYGLTAAVYWSFAVDLLASSSSTGDLTPAFWAVLGLSGTSGGFAGGLIERLGLRRAHVAVFLAVAAATALIGLAPGTLAAVWASATLYGGPYMAIGAVLSLWNADRFPDRTADGLTVVVLSVGVGSVLGPALAGVLSGTVGLPTTFLLTAATTGLFAVVRPRPTGRGARRAGPHGRRDRR